MHSRLPHRWWAWHAKRQNITWKMKGSLGLNSRSVLFLLQSTLCLCSIPRHSVPIWLIVGPVHLIQVIWRKGNHTMSVNHDPPEKYLRFRLSFKHWGKANLLTRLPFWSLIGAPPPLLPQGLYATISASILASYRSFSSFSLFLRSCLSLIWAQGRQNVPEVEAFLRPQGKCFGLWLSKYLVFP